MGMKVSDLDTPAVLIDLDRMERNLIRMQRKADRFGVLLRPHAKTHKIPELARRQLEKGAVGITVSKVSEARVMVDAGIREVFIANQIVSPQKVGRLVELAQRARLSVGVDSAEGARLLSRVFSSAGHTIDYLLEIDTGLNRCGVPPGEPALALFREIRGLPGIRFRGIFTHAGQVYGARSLEEVVEISRHESRMMSETALLLANLGTPPAVVSVGSTPTMWVWEGFGEGVTEIRPGNYIFNDATQVALGVAGIEDCALTVMATVISRPERHRAVIDAGSKVLGLDKGAHGKGLLKGFGRLLGRDAVLERLSEEHGVLRVSHGDDLGVGDRVRILPNHACTVMNLMDQAYGLRGEEVVEEFTIAARGKVH